MDAYAGHSLHLLAFLDDVLLDGVAAIRQRWLPLEVDEVLVEVGDLRSAGLARLVCRHRLSQTGCIGIYKTALARNISRTIFFPHFHFSYHLKYSQLANVTLK